MTNPGQTTPWAKLPIPSEGQEPDVPVDLAALADPLDTLLKNVIGGSQAPTAPLSPTLVDASASIDSLNTTQSTQQSQITTLQGQVSGLSVTPWAASTSAEVDAFTIPGNTKSGQFILTYQVPTFTQRRLLCVWGACILGWSSSSITTALRTRLMIKNPGDTGYSSLDWNVANGNDQGHQLFYLQTVDAGFSVSVGLAADVYGTSVSNATVSTESMKPRLFMLALPWGTGPSVPFLGV